MTWPRTSPQAPSLPWPSGPPGPNGDEAATAGARGLDGTYGSDSAYTAQDGASDTHFAEAPQRQGGSEEDGQVGIPSRAAWWVLPGLLAGFVLSGVGAAIGQGLTHRSTSGLTDLLGEAGLWAAFIGTALLVSKRYGTGSLKRDYGLAVKPVDLLFGVVAAGAALLLTAVVVAAFQGTKFSGTNDQILTQQKGHGVGLVLVSLLVAIGAPFFEELFFRGFLRNALQERFGAHGAVWMQAGLFAMLHFGEASKLAGNVSVVLAMFGVGLVLGYAARLTGRLGAGMTAHCLFNLLAVASVV